MSSISQPETALGVDASTPLIKYFIYNYETTPEVAARWVALHKRVLTEEETDLIAYVKVIHAIGLQKNHLDCQQLKLFKDGNFLWPKIANRPATARRIPTPGVLKAELANINREIALNERRRHRLDRIVKRVLLCIEEHEGKSKADAIIAIISRLGKEIPRWQHIAAEEMYEKWAGEKEKEIDTVALSISVLLAAEHQEEHKQRWAAANTLVAEDKLPDLMAELERVIIPLKGGGITLPEWYVEVEP
ncbi:hypothetical protein BJ875DRAFT_472610 [Amylocarpus encephaloides]|uniref:Uncharacterized protein n=1 Tax=Amylocarpus encephaloides TaxID=45428 RepID=A0A9P8C1W0_9HELO|nr:hypothetical protein BJ875DRAFT_472610 [Amylocarpus encephaloides]